jgi:hypothetical protein
VVVGRGRAATLDVADPSVSERHATLLVRDDLVQLEVARGAGDVFVNDVPVSQSAQVRAGDEVRLGSVRLVFEAVPAVQAPRPRVASFDEWCHRLSEELTRAGTRRPVGVLALAPPSLNVAARQALARRVIDDVARASVTATWGELGGDLMVALLPEASREVLTAAFAHVPLIAGPRVRVVTAIAPDDGDDVDAVVGALWTRLLGPTVDDEEPVIGDPVMVRLFDLAEALAGSQGPVCLVGPPGTGRATLARRLAAVAGRPLVEVRAQSPGALQAACAGDAWVLARGCGAEALPLIAAARTRVLATAGAAPRTGFEAVLQVPPLHARPLDVPAMADAFLSRARRVLGRPRLHLGPDALPLLTAWSWPGNVRELKNVMFRAARAAVRDEVSRDSLPAAVSALAPREHLRGAMLAAERDLLLEALARTRWNVTAAAARLGMPRRTVVYRMAKLGLKRPAR